MPMGAESDNYLRSPTVQWGHNYRDPWAVIGKTVELAVGEDGIMAEFELRPPANEADPQHIVRLLWSGGWVRTASIGFRPLEWEENEFGGMDFTKWELLEWSLVPIPMNPDALANAMKGFMELEKEDDKPYANEHACRLRNPGDFQPDSFRRVNREHEGKRYAVIMGKLKNETTMTEQAYRYPKKTWKPNEARKHCTAHDGSFEAAQEEAVSSPQDSIQYPTTDALGWLAASDGQNDTAHNKPTEPDWTRIAELLDQAIKNLQEVYNE